MAILLFARWFVRRKIVYYTIAIVSSTRGKRDQPSEKLNDINNICDDGTTNEICFICDEQGKNELWYRCVYCCLWVHAECSGVDTPEGYRCDFCQRRLNKN